MLPWWPRREVEILWSNGPCAVARGRGTVTFERLTHVAAIFTLLFADAIFHTEIAGAQVFDFGQIDAFESMGQGTQRGKSPPKTIVDDGDRHTVFFTILEANTEAKIYWKSDNGDQTTLIHGPGVKAFQAIGQFKIEALGDETHSFKYGYMLLHQKSDKGH